MKQRQYGLRRQPSPIHAAELLPGTLPRPPALPTKAQFAAPVAGADEAGDRGEKAAAGLGVRVPGGLALAAEPGDHQRLRAAVLLDPAFAVAGADPGLL